MNYTYSIIIPHKNIPNLLQRCLDSIPQREDTQVIIVDDNSDPEIVDFKNFPGINRQNTKVIFSKEGKGAGYARNLALAHVQNTKWISFVDADDFLAESANDLMDKYTRDNSDVIFFKLDSVDSDTLLPSNRKNNRNSKFTNAIETNNLDILRFKMYGPYTKFISYELINKNNIKFDEVIAANDVMFSIMTGYFAEKILTDKDVLYVVTERSDSLVNTPSLENLECRFSVTIRSNCFLNEINQNKYRGIIFPHIYNLFKYKFTFGLKSLFVYLRKTPIKLIFQDIRRTLKQIS